MLSDGTWTYTWQHGRQLAGMSKAGTTISYAYNADGIRTQKTANGTVTKYDYLGSQLVHMTSGSNTLHFKYDNLGAESVNYNGTEYYYVKNAQGDITGIANTSGTVVVEYTYDAWGNILSTTGSMAATLGAVNPFRYRGYVYDTETGLYYLQTRYYNPAMGRFINTDAFGVPTLSQDALTDKNLFAYCDNNPVTRKDDGGLFWNTIFGGLIGGVSAVILRVDEKESAWQAFVRGAATGALAGFCLDVSIATGGTAAVLIATAGGATSSLLDTYWHGVNTNTTPSISEYVISGISGGLINTAFGAAGREVTNSVGNTLPDIAKAMCTNFTSAVTNSARRVIATKLTNTIATNVVSSAGGSLTTWLCSKKLQRAIEYLR